MRLGSASELPYPAGHFSKACAVHALYFWPSLEDGLRELQRVLALGGRLVLAVRTQQPTASRINPSRYGLTDAGLSAIADTLNRLGFRDVTTCVQPGLDRQTMAAIVAVR